MSYSALGCNKCHGEGGTGSLDQSLFDDLGEPSRPRDPVHEPFKGGREPEAIYIRIVTGMPGTAHPAALNLPQGQLAELVAYVRSLARGPEYLLTNYERRARASTPSYLNWLKELSSANR
jgi:mono/diheme cytochrome c family protein